MFSEIFTNIVFLFYYIKHMRGALRETGWSSRNSYCPFVNGLRTPFCPIDQLVYNTPWNISKSVSETIWSHFPISFRYPENNSWNRQIGQFFSVPPNILAIFSKPSPRPFGPISQLVSDILGTFPSLFPISLEHFPDGLLEHLAHFPTLYSTGL